MATGCGLPGTCCIREVSSALSDDAGRVAFQSTAGVVITPLGHDHERRLAVFGVGPCVSVPITVIGGRLGTDPTACPARIRPVVACAFDAGRVASQSTAGVVITPLGHEHERRLAVFGVGSCVTVPITVIGGRLGTDPTACPARIRPVVACAFDAGRVASQSTAGVVITPLGHEHERRLAVFGVGSCVTVPITVTGGRLGTDPTACPAGSCRWAPAVARHLCGRIRPVGVDRWNTGKEKTPLREQRGFWV